jgi:hypothetical protein
MYIFIYICIYIYMNIYIYIYKYIYIYVYIYIHKCTSTWSCPHPRSISYVRFNIYINICVNAYIYSYKNTYILKIFTSKYIHISIPPGGTLGTTPLSLLGPLSLAGSYMSWEYQQASPLLHKPTNKYY